MSLRIWAALLAAAAITAACAAHQSGLTPDPPSPAPSDLPAIPTPRTPRPSPVIPGNVSIDSNPQGLAITINGTSKGVTPLTTAAPFSFGASTIVVHGPGADYSVSFQASGNVPSSIYYNTQADDAGHLQSISTTSIGARPSDVARGGPAALPLSEHPRDAYSDSELYVTYEPNKIRASLPGRDLLSLPDERELRVVPVQRGALEDRAQQLRARAGVVAVQRVALVHLLAQPVIPDDPFFLYQWDMTVIRAPEAWELSEGNSAIDVAVVDTGFDAHHPDLQGKVTYAESDLFGVTTPGFGAAQDELGHGTNVSGIIAAATNNAVGYAGTGFNVSLQEYDVFNGDAASGSDIATAIMHAVANGARVINLSLGSGVLIDPGMYAAVQTAIAHGVAVVAATGNQGVSTVEEPGADPGVISVGASAIDDSGPSVREYVASYSNYGPLMTLIAPGGDPSGSSDTDYLHRVNNLWTSTENGGSCTITAADGCGYRGSAGTSMAAPHVSAAAALMLSVNPALTPATIARILRATADDVGDPKQNAGRLNLERALASAAGLPQPSPPQPLNFVAIAYTVSSGSNVPNILDVTYPRGVPVASDGSFRIADVNAQAGPFEIGVWYDENGDGAVDAGDYFGSTGPCTPSAVCPNLALTAHPVGAGFVLH